MKRKLRSNLERGGTRLGRAARAVARARPDRRRHGQAEDRDRQHAPPSSRSASATSTAWRAWLKDAIRAAGGLPFEVRTAAPSDFITSAGRRGGYILPSRDLITNDIEVQVEGALLDGMLVPRLLRQDHARPADGRRPAEHPDDRGRLRLPAERRVQGRARRHRGGVPEGGLSSRRAASRCEDLTGMADNAVRGPGVCAGMGTANSMHIVCEALGMALPGTAPVLANSARMLDYVRPAGARIVQMVVGRLQAARHHDAELVRQRRHGGAGAVGLDQLRQAPAGDRARGGSRRRRVRAVRRSTPRRCRCSRRSARTATAASRSSRPRAARAR